MVGRLLMFANPFASLCLPATADHHREKRASQETRCISAAFNEVSKAGSSMVDKARCKEAGDHTPILVSSARRCIVDERGSQNPEGDER